MPLQHAAGCADLAEVSPKEQLSVVFGTPRHGNLGCQHSRDVQITSCSECFMTRVLDHAMDLQLYVVFAHTISGIFRCCEGSNVKQV